MSGISIVHALIGLLTLLLAIGILSRRKGDRLHRQLGWIVVCGMVLALASAITLGVLHVFDAFDAYAVAALAALLGAVAASRCRDRLPDWRFWHGALMCFTVLTAVAALSGVIGGILIGDGSGPRFYRLFNILIILVTVSALLMINLRLGKLIGPGRSKRPLLLYNGGVALVTAFLVIMQAP
ncbi:MAG: hypothetical protein A3H91_09460 [Gammaproteobacteria bacterium RIFCSPLOWO2_02_FULL_61_13]|nr:MAG: hypothetical protein A3H91_09460 [Gammaproteobacteria bacterium RIFCSPLOWO2_02_FULL_61_13]